MRPKDLLQYAAYNRQDMHMIDSSGASGSGELFGVPISPPGGKPTLLPDWRKNLTRQGDDIRDVDCPVNVDLSTVTIPGDITDGLTTFKLSKLNYLLIHLRHGFLDGALTPELAHHIRLLQGQLDQTPSELLSATLGFMLTEEYANLYHHYCDWYIKTFGVVNHLRSSLGPLDICRIYETWCHDWYNYIHTLGGVPSPLDQFSIVPFLPLKIGKFYFSFTNPSFFLLLTLCFVLFFFHLVTKKGGGKSVPNAWQSLVELIYDFVPNLVNEQIGGLSGNVKQKFFPCISVTFTFSLFRNLQGMIPYSFTVTSHFIVTLGLSFSLFIGITIVGFAKNGLHFLSFSLPAGVPLPLAPFLVLLELIPHCFRALSLGIRLFANMMAGHSLVKILSGFAWTMLCMNDLFYFIGSTGPFFIVLALTGLELGVAILQAYVFTILICIYLNDAINLH